MKRSMYRKGLVLSVLLVGLLLLGFTYSAWSTKLHVFQRATTGAMKILFAGTEAEGYRAVLADARGAAIEELEADFEPQEDGKALKINFKSGIPMEELLKGGFLVIDLPLSPAEDSSVTDILEVTPNLEERGEILDAAAGKAVLLAGGKAYAPAGEANAFVQTMQLEWYQAIKHAEGYGGQILLRLSPAGMEQLKALPKELKLEAAGLEELSEEDLEDIPLPVGNGMVVTYSLTVPILIDQSEAGTDTVSVFRPAKVYAYWTDRLAASLEAAVFYELSVTVSGKKAPETEETMETAPRTSESGEPEHTEQAPGAADGTEKQENNTEKQENSTEKQAEIQETETAPVGEEVEENASTDKTS